jgi:hypothetical protein
VKPTLYISSRISDPDPAVQAKNIETGIGAAEYLEKNGFTVFCPHRDLRPFYTAALREYGPQRAWRLVMRECIRQIKNCGAVLFLPGWEESRGAAYEHSYVSLLNQKGWRQIKVFSYMDEILKAYPP